MFQIGDRVKQRYGVRNTRDPGYHNPDGTVVDVKGRWVTVKHDAGGNLHRLVGPRYEYLIDELEHLNPLLRFADEL